LEHDVCHDFFFTNRVHFGLIDDLIFNQRSPYIARTKGIDGYPMSSTLQGGSTGQSDEPMFG
jgi:hypothetical protein